MLTHDDKNLYRELEIIDAIHYAIWITGADDNPFIRVSMLQAIEDKARADSLAAKDLETRVEEALFMMTAARMKLVLIQDITTPPKVR